MAAATIGSAAHAEGYYSYWQDSGPDYYQPPPYYRPYYRPGPMPRLERPERSRNAKKEKLRKQTAAKPQGPLIISVSLSKQRVRIYDANGFFAEAPVSTGMPGHGTPMGVFSVIQKQKFHRSNIYSGAPMPYMQRITWSGIALHAGVLPGYPASHGCIRMPPAFAIKMYGWTRMGARVLVTPGEIAPESFSNPLLPSLKIQPQLTVKEAPQPDEPVAPKADKGAPEIKADAAAATTLDLRSTVGHGDARPAADDSAAVAPLRTADASNDAPAKMMSDAASAGIGPTPAGAKPDTANAQPPTAIGSAPAAPGSGVTVGAANSRPEPTAAPADPHDAAAGKPADTAASAENPAGPKGPDAKAADSSPSAADIDAKKDQARLTDFDKPADANLEQIRAKGQIAVFISGKDSKLYVRQNFAPLFDVPVTIAPSDRPLGTHVFTAEVDKSDSNVLHWSVVSLPMSAHAIERASGIKLVSVHVLRRRGRAPVAVEQKPLPVPDSPAEALDRITLPADVMARIAEAMTTGASIIVSDQGINQGETGEGTDFIVSLR